MSSMNGLSLGKYVPSSTIRTEPLTSKYAIQGDIGRGKFAVVRKCVNIETGEVVAAKVIRKRRKGKSCREEILKEVVMLEYAMVHPRLVRLCEVFETPSELILVTEFCSGGELFHECVIEESFEEKDVVHLMLQILEGICFLHENNIVHLDLKPQNILLTEPFPQGDIKICDLGFACLTNTDEDIRDIIGTPDYVAPEVLDYEPLSIQTDMWSVGVLAYVMLTAHSPFAGETQQETFCNISQVKLDFPPELFSHISPIAQDFIRKLLIKDPRDRMTACQSLDHPWLKVARAQMDIMLPIKDHTAALAQSMAPPSNFNPDRRNSFSKAPITPSLSSQNGETLSSSPHLCQKGRRMGCCSKQDGVISGASEDLPDDSVSSSPASHLDETFHKTIEEMGIDSKKFLNRVKMSRESIPAEEIIQKRQSLEIPLKKAKCGTSHSDEIFQNNNAESTQSLLHSPDLNWNAVETATNSALNASSFSESMESASKNTDFSEENSIDLQTQ